MNRLALSSAVVIAVGCMVLFAGCGSSSSSSSSSNSASVPSAPETTPPAASTPSTTTTQSSSKPLKAPPLSGAALAHVVTTCKQQIKTQKTLTAGAKTKLEAICEKAAKGDIGAVKQAAREVCEEVVNHSKVPATGKEQSLSACKK